MHLQGKAVLLKAPNFQAPLDSTISVCFFRGEAYSKMYTIPAKEVSLVLNSESSSRSSIPQLPQVHHFRASATTVSTLHLMSAPNISASLASLVAPHVHMTEVPHACICYLRFTSFCTDRE